MHYHHSIMRTTLDIDEDILNAAKELAAKQKVSAGRVISDLVRKALVGPAQVRFERSESGFAVFPPGARIVTAEEIQKLIDENPD